MRTRLFPLLAALMLCLSCCFATTALAADTYTEEEVVNEVDSFFASGAKGLADLVKKAFEDHGAPVGFITGTEGGGAFVVGLRYGKGTLRLKNGGTRSLYWQGPSIGLDWGGNASKVFTLVYGMNNIDDIYQRFPGVDGSAYLLGGFSMNYQRSGDITLAPIRSGAGLRIGANIGYLHYTREEHVNPF